MSSSLPVAFVVVLFLLLVSLTTMTMSMGYRAPLLIVELNAGFTTARNLLRCYDAQRRDPQLRVL